VPPVLANNKAYLPVCRVELGSYLLVSSGVVVY